MKNPDAKPATDCKAFQRSMGAAARIVPAKVARPDCSRLGVVELLVQVEALRGLLVDYESALCALPAEKRVGIEGRIKSIGAGIAALEEIARRMRLKLKEGKK